LLAVVELAPHNIITVVAVVAVLYIILHFQ
jgi:hypothetical protein